LKKIRDRFDGDFVLKLHLAPPLFSRRDPNTGEPIKSAYGPWIFSVMKILTRFKFLRGKPIDPFGKTKERQMERQLIREYELITEELLRGLTKNNYAQAIIIAKIPEKIRGFDLIKQQHAESAKSDYEKLLKQFRNSTGNAACLKNIESAS